jgi:hypothetical protein
MRDYGKISPAFWIGETGKKLRGFPDAQVLAIYLMTSPHSAMTGIFHCPILYMGHETGLGTEGASKALTRLISEGFCEYEESSETVFVVRMASYQIAPELKAGDLRVLGLRKEYSKLPAGPIKSRFLAEYGEVFHLIEPTPKSPEPQAPYKPLPSQEQEQEQEQAQEQDIKDLSDSKESSPSCPTQKIIELFKAHAPLLVQPRIVPDAVKTAIAARWRQDPQHQSFEFWEWFFERCNGSLFLSGRAAGKNGSKPFRVGLEWIVNSTNFAKIINGNFDNERT